MFGGIWDEQKRQTMVKAGMDTEINENILLADHEFL